jgi:hypothetical protein
LNRVSASLFGVAFTKTMTFIFVLLELFRGSRHWLPLHSGRSGGTGIDIFDRSFRTRASGRRKSLILYHPREVNGRAMA